MLKMSKGIYFKNINGLIVFLKMGNPRYVTENKNRHRNREKRRHRKPLSLPSAEESGGLPPSVPAAPVRLGCWGVGPGAEPWRQRNSVFQRKWKTPEQVRPLQRIAGSHTLAAVTRSPNVDEPTW